MHVSESKKYMVKGVEKGYILKIENSVKINVHIPLKATAIEKSKRSYLQSEYNTVFMAKTKRPQRSKTI